MSTDLPESSELHKRLVQQIREMFPGRLAISPEQFASLAGKNRVWGYRRIWSSQVTALGTEEGDDTQSYQILIEEVANYFVSNSKLMSKVALTPEGDVKPAANGSKRALAGC